MQNTVGLVHFKVCPYCLVVNAGFDGGRHPQHRFHIGPSIKPRPIEFDLHLWLSGPRAHQVNQTRLSEGPK